MRARQNKERGEEERQKDKKGRYNADKAAFLPIIPLLSLCLVHYSREIEEEKTKREVERKDRKIKKVR
jgi:hypothetical protein